MFMRVHVCGCARAPVQKYLLVHAYICVYASMSASICMGECISHMCMCTCMCMCVYVQMCVRGCAHEWVGGCV